jgi:hypothetical protein
MRALRLLPMTLGGKAQQAGLYLHTPFFDQAMLPISEISQGYDQHAYEHRNITGGIGHNLPQEAPQAFAQAIVDVTEG